MPIDLKKCCGTHSKEKEDNGECCQTKEKEDNGECCQTKEKDNAETLTYENETKRSQNE